MFLRQVLLLSMEANSVDDQYEGCKVNMSHVVDRKYLNVELVGKMKSAWERGKQWWSKEKITKTKDNLEGDNYYIALYVYTDNATGIFSMFNADTRTGKNDYIQRTYQWYSLHFFLTQAVQVLKESERESGVQCRTTYRGTNSTFERMVKGREIRLGSFISSSLNRAVAKGFGRVSCFEIYTCYGADIVQYSAHPKQEEVLIPPYEKFKVLEVKRDWCDMVYVLNSTGVRSDLNCAAASGRSLIDHSQSLWVVNAFIMMFIQSRFLH